MCQAGKPEIPKTQKSDIRANTHNKKCLKVCIRQRPRHCSHSCRKLLIILGQREHKLKEQRWRSSIVKENNYETVSTESSWGKRERRRQEPISQKSVHLWPVQSQNLAKSAVALTAQRHTFFIQSYLRDIKIAVSHAYGRSVYSQVWPVSFPSCIPLIF